MAAAQSWSDLQTDVMCLIQKCLSIVDYIRFSAVCVSWYIAAKQNPYPSAPDIPWLMRADTSSPFSRASCIKSNPAFLRLSPANDSNNKLYRIPLLRVEDFHELTIISSINEWLVTVNKKFEVHLLNPFTGVQIQLPSHTTLPIQDEYHHEFFSYNRILEVVVVVPPRPREDPGSTSAAALANGCIAVAIVRKSYITTLAYAQLGSSSWIIPEIITQNGENFDTILPYKGLIYAVTSYARVVALDFSSPIPNFIDMTLNLQDYIYLSGRYGDYGDIYLVESSSRLLLVRGTHLRGRVKVEVYKLDADQCRWVLLDTLGTCSLFLGRNQSLSLSTVDYPQLRCNCIYFSYGLYNLEDGSEEKYYSCDNSLLPLWSLLWVTPCLGGYATPAS